MSRVLVTGASGFIGRYLLEELAQSDNQIVAVSRSAQESQYANVKWITGDLLSTTFLTQLFEDEKFDRVIHLAWETRHGYFWNAPENLDWVKSSLQLLKCFADSGGEYFLGLGTGAEYAPDDHQVCIAGVTRTSPTSFYGLSKKSFYELARGYCQLRNVEMGWGRVFSLMGQGDSPSRLIPSLVSTLAQEKTFVCLGAEKMRDFLDVRDCASSIAFLTKHMITGDFNVCSGVPVALGDLANLVGAKMGKAELIELEHIAPVTEPLVLFGEPFWESHQLGFRPSYSIWDSIQFIVQEIKGENDENNHR